MYLEEKNQEWLKNYVFPYEGKKQLVCLPSNTSGGKHWCPFTTPLPLCLLGMERQGTSCQPSQLPQGPQAIEGGRLHSEPVRTAGIHLCFTSQPLTANSFCRSLRCRSGTGREASLSTAQGSLLQHCSTPCVPPVGSILVCCQWGDFHSDVTKAHPNTFSQFSCFNYSYRMLLLCLFKSYDIWDG